MFKIITSLFLAASLPVLAQTAVKVQETETTADSTANAAVNDGSTTVTTTVKTDPVVAPAPTTIVSTTKTLENRTAEGIVSEVNQGIGHMSVIVPDSSIPMTFAFNDQTRMANLKNEQVTWSEVKLGQAVTVTYVEGPAGDLVAKEIAFGDPAKLLPVPVEAATTTTTVTTPATVVASPAPPITEEISTTTTTTVEEEME